MPVVSRGEVWLVDFGNPQESQEPEQAKVRPALVLSVNELNHSVNLAIVLPITTTMRSLLAHLAIDPPEGGLNRKSAIQCDQIRAVSQRRFKRLIGTVSNATLREIQDRVTLLLGFF